jgi:hypothetical protein
MFVGISQGIPAGAAGADPTAERSMHGTGQPPSAFERLLASPRSRCPRPSFPCQPPKEQLFWCKPTNDYRLEMANVLI